MLENILNYQEIEKEKIALENELLKSSDREKASEIQKGLKEQHSRLITLENLAKSTNEAYKKSQAKYDEYLKKLEDLENKISLCCGENVDVYDKMMKDFLAVASVLEKEIANIYARVQQISKEYEDVIKKSKSDREKFDKYKASYTTLKSSIDPKIEDDANKLALLAKQIEPKLLKFYQTKRDGHIFPVFVEVSNNKCGGCRMEISASKLAQMKTNEFGIIECENCGRYIYSK